MTGSAPRPWGVVPHIFDICWVKFPYHGEGGRPADDMHPCLIIQVLKDGDDFWAGCVYGTSKLRQGARDQIDAIVMNFEEIDRMGLRCHTRFDFDRVMWLPWDDLYFVESKSNPGSPVHSRATETLVDEVKQTLRIRQDMGLPAYPIDPIPRVPPYAPDDRRPPQKK
ncbi:MAG: hypothetical protein U9P68_04710 [Pseudomonadota bacterium]|nr:hypothetical protein [Pseudomonadota bacterium]